jgi:Methyltransferase domain
MQLRMRREKMRLFFSIAGNTSTQSLLDIGGTVGFGGEFQEFKTRFRFACTINLVASRVQGAAGHVVVGNGCQLPFETASFDWVFSNAVVEHVGGWEQQRHFSAEVRRVARSGYFIGTPNRYFPIDPHTLLPLFQFLPPASQVSVCRRFALTGARKEPECVYLLSKGQLLRLFPEAHVVALGLPILKNNLVAFHRV